MSRRHPCRGVSKSRRHPDTNAAVSSWASRYPCLANRPHGNPTSKKARYTRPTPNCDDIEVEISARTMTKRRSAELNHKVNKVLYGEAVALGSKDERHELREIAHQAAEELRAAMEASVNGSASRNGEDVHEIADAATSRVDAAVANLDMNDAEAWPALGSLESANGYLNRTRANSWELVSPGHVATTDLGVDTDADTNAVAGTSTGVGGDVDVGAVGSVEPWEVVKEDTDGIALVIEEAEEDADWVLTSDADAGLESDSANESNPSDDESKPSSVVMVAPCSYLQALKLSTAALPEHPRTSERAAMRAARMAHSRRQRARGNRAASCTAGLPEDQEALSDYAALKDTHNHATRSRKSKQSMANRERRIAAKSGLRSGGPGGD
mmetsp:Transcript_6762/g.12110  ORF Transcript_6762/g.12110 Transcript_6762/m.12110 type:complete len:383 (+) Transcript_6762:454-1602(+)